MSSETVYFYTFCVDIKRHSQDDLIRALKMLLHSIHKHVKKYKLICYTNFAKKYNLSTQYNIAYKEYYDNSSFRLYDNMFLNLSFNKINLYKDLYDEYKIDFTWIDLDTIITTDISYINDLSNVFIENGGECLDKNILFTNNNTITVPRNRYIQGNFWKLDYDLHKKLIETLVELLDKKLTLRYDLQDLFNYYIYIKHAGNLDNIHILGNNIRQETLNGLAVWSKVGNTHATMDGLKNLYYQNNTLRSKYYPDKEVHLVSFTFNTLKVLHKDCAFTHLFNKEEQKKKIGVFGTCRIDDYNIEDFKQIRKKYPYTYTNKHFHILVRPLGYTTTSSDVLQNIRLINEQQKITDPFLFKNIFLKHGGEIVLDETCYDYIVVEICSIKKIIHIGTNYIIPYEIEGKHNKTDFRIETEDFEETVGNIKKIRSLLGCNIILLPPIIEFSGKAVLGVHENIVPEKVLGYRKDIINRLQTAARDEDGIFFYNWNDSILEQGVDIMIKDQFHFTEYGKKYISNKIYNIIKADKVYYDIENVLINIPHDNDKRHKYYQMFKERGGCEALFRLLVKKLYDDNILDKTRNIIDLGAWIGDNAIPWSMIIKGVVYAIDPSIENIQYIHELMFLNKVSNIKTIQRCISDTEDYVYTDHDMKHAQFNMKKGRTKVRTITLDVLYHNGGIMNVDFIHLDVEGFEHKVIKGSIQLINGCRPLIVWENHIETDNYRDTIGLLEKLGYKTFLINERFPHCRHDCRNLISIPDDRFFDVGAINIMFNHPKFNHNKADAKKPLLIHMN